MFFPSTYHVFFSFIILMRAFIFHWHWIEREKERDTSEMRIHSTSDRCETNDENWMGEYINVWCLCRCDMDASTYTLRQTTRMQAATRPASHQMWSDGLYPFPFFLISFRILLFFLRVCRLDCQMEWKRKDSRNRSSSAAKKIIIIDICFSRLPRPTLPARRANKKLCFSTDAVYYFICLWNCNRTEISYLKSFPFHERQATTVTEGEWK